MSALEVGGGEDLAGSPFGAAWVRIQLGGLLAERTAPCCLTARRGLVLSIGGGAFLRRRSRRYSTKAGSAGDVPPLTNW